MKKERLQIEGMHCENCSLAVTEALTALAGVAEVQVNVPQGIADVVYDVEQVSRQMLCDAIEEIGFSAR